MHLSRGCMSNTAKIVLPHGHFHYVCMCHVNSWLHSLRQHLLFPCSVSCMPKALVCIYGDSKTFHSPFLKRRQMTQPSCEVDCNTAVYIYHRIIGTLSCKRLCWAHQQVGSKINAAKTTAVQLNENATRSMLQTCTSCSEHPFIEKK